MEQQITNTKIVMPKKPTGMPNDSNFKIVKEDLRDLNEKEGLDTPNPFTIARPFIRKIIVENNPFFTVNFKTFTFDNIKKRK